MMEPPKRTKVACNKCRQRKKKCNGAFPCSNCNSEEECHYSEKLATIDKPKPDRQSARHAISLMQQKVDRLEYFMANISDKLDRMHSSANTSSSGFSGGGSGGIGSRADINGLPEIVGRSNDGDDSDDYLSEEDEPEADPGTTDSGTQAETSKINHQDYAFHEQFFGSHSFASACSAKSLTWIKKTLEKPKQKALVTQFERINQFFFMKCSRMFKKIIEPIEINNSNRTKFLVRPLPENGKMVKEIINSLVLGNRFIGYSVPPKTTNRLLDQYYNNGKLNNSQLLLLCCMLSLAFSVTFINQSTNKPNLLAGYTETEISRIQDDLQTSIMLLYQRVCIMSQGIITVQALLVMILSFEINGNNLIDINHMLLSNEIRYCQEFGFHRPETYDHLPAEEVITRRVLWSICASLDVELCYRNGKPPILSPFDVVHTGKFEYEMFFKLFKLPLDSIDHYHERSRVGFIKPGILETFYNQHNQIALVKYITHSVSKLRYYAYWTLFTAVGDFKTVETLEKILEELNHIAVKLVDLCVEEFKPRFYDDPGFNYETNFNFRNSDGSGGWIDLEEFLGIQFSFLYHLMITNRVPFLIDLSNETPKVGRFREIFMKSARTILHLGKLLRMESITPFRVIWCSFYPFAAFLLLSSVIMNNPTKSDIDGDIQLLIETSNILFNMSFGSDPKNIPHIELTNRFHLQNITMKILIQIVISVVETKTGRVIEVNDEYHAQVAVLKKVAPELYGRALPRDNAKLNSYYKVESLDSAPSPEVSSGGDLEEPRSSLSNILVSHEIPTPSSIENLLNESSDKELNWDLDMFDDPLNTFLSEQINNLPNIFYDNNLGF